MLIRRRRVGEARIPLLVRCANRPKTVESVSKGSTPCVTHRLPAGSLHAPYGFPKVIRRDR